MHSLFSLKTIEVNLIPFALVNASLEVAAMHECHNVISHSLLLRDPLFPSAAATEEEDESSFGRECVTWHCTALSS